MTHKRKPIGKKLRFEVFKRDSFTCQYCGGVPPRVVLHVDHIVAVARGGDNAIDNLATACSACNLGKGARDLKIAPVSLAKKAAAIAEAEARLRGYNDILNAQRSRIEADIWRVVLELTGERETTRAKFASIKTFVNRLGVHEVLDAVEVAQGRRPVADYAQWQYFCGVCWTKIRSNEA